VFPTLTAPSFGEVHTRVAQRHTCTDRRISVRVDPTSSPQSPPDSPATTPPSRR
jgi:hypothetical protein